MIKFFRHIRKSLLEQKKMGKYFKYAFGEIVLVVIGILIALQINNWNENRKNSIKINDALKALRYDLVKDSILIKRHLNFTEKEIDFVKTCLDRIRNQSSKVDTLIKVAKTEFQYHWIAPLQYSNSMLQTIRDSGLFENLSDSLRLGITNLQNTQTYHINSIENFNKLYREKLNNFMSTYVINVDGDGKSLNYLAAKLSWKDINNKDFVVKFDGLVELRYQIWLQYKMMLSASKKRTNILMNLVNDNITK